MKKITKSQAGYLLPYNIGLLVDTKNVPAWVSYSIKKLIHYEFIHIKVIFTTTSSISKKLNSNSWNPFNSMLINMFNYIDKIIYPQSIDALALENLESIFDNKFTPKWIDIPMHTESTTNKNGELANLDLDFIISYSKKRPSAEMIKFTKRGVLAHYFGQFSRRYCSHFGITEVVRRHDITESGLYLIGKTPEKDKKIYTSFAATHMSSVRANNNPVYWKTAAFASRVSSFHYQQEKNVEKFLPFQAISIPHNKENNKISNKPKACQLISHVTTCAIRNLLSRFYFEQWSLFFHMSKSISFDFTNFIEITPPTDRFWADPFIIARNDRYYIFFEELIFNNKRAHISVLELLPDGRWQKVRPVLKRPYHLSYPFLFVKDEKLYMIPESIENKTIEVYKCVSFPDDWELESILIENIMASDSTLIFNNGIWWLWANVIEHNGASINDETFLFFSSDLFNAPFIIYQNNPVISDARYSRPAGDLYKANNNLFRFSQICSRKSYGYGLNLNQITKLSGNCYREHPIKRMEPSWRKDLLGIHTINHVEGCTVIDGNVRRSKYKMQKPVVSEFLTQS